MIVDLRQPGRVAVHREGVFGNSRIGTAHGNRLGTVAHQIKRIIRVCKDWQKYCHDTHNHYN